MKEASVFYRQPYERRGFLDLQAPEHAAVHVDEEEAYRKFRRIPPGFTTTVKDPLKLASDCQDKRGSGGAKKQILAYGAEEETVVAVSVFLINLSSFLIKNIVNIIGGLTYGWNSRLYWE